MDKNVTKQGLLKLKDSKPVPITAHSHEIIIPCVYTEKVQKFLDKEGIKLPLTHHKLAELKRIAQKTKGHLKENDLKEDEGDSHATGTINLKSSKKTTSAKAQNINKITIINAPQTKRRKRGKAKLRTTSGLATIPEARSLLPLARPPPTQTLIGPSNYAMIRAVQNPTNPIIDSAKILEEGYKKQREAIKKREDELKANETANKARMDALERSVDEEKHRQQAIINSLLTSRLPAPQPVVFNVTPNGDIKTTPTPKKEPEPEHKEPEPATKEESSSDEEEEPAGSSSSSSSASSSTAHTYPDFLSAKLLDEIRLLIPANQRPIIVGPKTQDKLYDAISDVDPAILQYAQEVYRNMDKAGARKKTHYKQTILDAIRERFNF